jgi:predicted ATPase
LTECDELRLLVTSRSPLTVVGEQTVIVSPLDVPSDGALPAEALAADAVRLFIERATETRSSFRLSDQQVGSVVSICRRLDGLPLAIELAAARANVLTVEEIADRLDDIFALLSTRAGVGCARHQTLQAAIDWTAALLSPEQRELLERLAIFDGPFELADVEALSGPHPSGAPSAFELLAQLARCSLVSLAGSSPSGRSSYRLLEPIRQYAAGLRRRPAGRDDVHEQIGVPSRARRSTALSFRDRLR